MSKLVDSRSGLGILIAQHFNYRADNYDYNNRHSILCVRMLGRQDTLDAKKYKTGTPNDPLGHIIYDINSLGDLLLFYNWGYYTGEIPDPDLVKARDISAWSFIYPVKIVRPNGFTPIPPPCCILPMPPDMMILPIGKVSDNLYVVDNSFEKVKVELNKDWQLFPINYFGLSLTGTQTEAENKQFPMFYPADPRLISAPYSNDKYNTRIHDVNSNMEISEDIWAQLNTFTYIVRKPKDVLTLKPNNNVANNKHSLGWMIGRSGSENLLCGLVIDFKDCNEPKKEKPINIYTPKSTYDYFILSVPVRISLPPEVIETRTVISSPVAPPVETVSSFRRTEAAPITTPAPKVTSSITTTTIPRWVTKYIPLPIPILRSQPKILYRKKKEPARYGLVNSFDGGFIEIGDKEDKHRNGTDETGEPINSCHISTDTFFFKDKEQDAPIEFSDFEFYQGRSKFDYFTDAFLCYDPKSTHFDAAGEKKEGLWKFMASTPMSNWHLKLQQLQNLLVGVGSIMPFIGGGMCLASVPNKLNVEAGKKVTEKYGDEKVILTKEEKIQVDAKKLQSILGNSTQSSNLPKIEDQANNFLETQGVFQPIRRDNVGGVAFLSPERYYSILVNNNDIGKKFLTNPEMRETYLFTVEDTHFGCAAADENNNIQIEYSWGCEDGNLRINRNIGYYKYPLIDITPQSLKLIFGGSEAEIYHRNSIDRKYILPDEDGTLITKERVDELISRTQKLMEKTIDEKLKTIENISDYTLSLTLSIGLS